jgi:hypothetical protein
VIKQFDDSNNSEQRCRTEYTNNQWNEFNIVLCSNTVIQPIAMMVKKLTASIALRAMFGSFIDMSFAHMTVVLEFSSIKFNAIILSTLSHLSNVAFLSS